VTSEIVHVSTSAIEYKQVIVVIATLNMRKGKLAAQVAHASMKFLMDDVPEIKGRLLIKELSDEELAWVRGPFAKIVARVESEMELFELIAKGRFAGMTVHPIIDSGRTEFNGVPTLTCAAFGPHEASKFDAITGHLKLL